jgi:hypothetical protein
VTRHSVVRSPPPRAGSSDGDLERSGAHVRAIGGMDGTDGADEVLLGVDTHLDVNVAVALD